MDPRRKPVARGDLGRSPLARVLLGISRRALDGTLVLWPDGGHGSPDRLRFEGGRFTAAYLVAGGRPESFHALFERRAAHFAFYTENLVGGLGTTPPSNVAALVAASLRAQLPRADVDHELARLGGETLRLRPKSHLDRFELTAEERQVAESLATVPQRAERVVAAADDPETARRVLYLLAISRELVRGATSDAPAVEPSEGRSLMPPPGVGPAMEPVLPPLGRTPHDAPPLPGVVSAPAGEAGSPVASSEPPESERHSRPLEGPGLYGLSIAPPPPEEPAARNTPAPRTSHVAPAPHAPGPFGDPLADATPYDPVQRYQEALRRLARRDPEGALEILGDVRTRAPRAAKLLTLRARLLLEIEGLDAAQEEIDALVVSALEAAPRHPDALALRDELLALRADARAALAGPAPARRQIDGRPSRHRRHSGTSSTPARGLFGWLRGKSRD